MIQFLDKYPLEEALSGFKRNQETCQRNKFNCYYLLLLFIIMKNIQKPKRTYKKKVKKEEVQKKEQNKIKRRRNTRIKEDLQEILLLLI